MFHNIPKKIQTRMKYLEIIDSQDRTDGTSRLKRLRQIPPETGKFISLLASSCPTGNFIEIGTSAGYSTLWLYLAAMYTQSKIKTFEILPEKIKLAKETFRQSGVTDIIELYEGDARDYLDNIENISFCFLDAEKDIYNSCYEIIKDKIILNGMIIADNAINHYDSIKDMVENIMKNKEYDCLIVPIGKGELICKKIK
jgi:predicted O-methyltransferase YrrM